MFLAKKIFNAGMAILCAVSAIEASKSAYNYGKEIFTNSK
jgi:hypothetical protein